MKTYQLLLMRTFMDDTLHTPITRSVLEINFKYAGTDAKDDIEEFVAQRYPGWDLQEVEGPGYCYLRTTVLGRRFKVPKV
jgi:hypothetical protein